MSDPINAVDAALAALPALSDPIKDLERELARAHGPSAYTFATPEVAQKLADSAGKPVVVWVPRGNLEAESVGLSLSDARTGQTSIFGGST